MVNENDYQQRIDAAAIWFEFDSEEPLRLSTFFFEVGARIAQETRVNIMAGGTVQTR